MTRARSRAIVAALCIAGSLVGAASAAAQGQGPPTTTPGRGRAGRPGAPPSAGAGRGGAPTTSAEFTVRNFGTWVDDTYVLAPGEAWVGIGASLWRLSSVDQVEAPAFDASFGIAPRIHVAATVPLSTLRYPDGFSERSLGDTYVSIKIGLRDPQTGFGLAVAPVLEVLADGSWPDPDGGTIGRVHWGLPVNLEYRGTGFRVYGSTGYFSRGAVFGSGTLDVAVGERAGVLGLITHTYSTKDAVNAPESQLRTTRTDASGGAYVILRPSVAVYGLAGRTVSALDDYGSRFFVSGGISFRVAQPRTTQDK
jgi:hypothetical protein